MVGALAVIRDDDDHPLLTMTERERFGSEVPLIMVALTAVNLLDKREKGMKFQEDNRSTSSLN